MSKSRNNALEFSSVGSIIIDAAAGVTAGNFGAIQFLIDKQGKIKLCQNHEIML